MPAQPISALDNLSGAQPAFSGLPQDTSTQSGARHPANGQIPSSAGDPSATLFRRQTDGGMRRHLSNRQRAAAGTSTSAAAQQPDTNASEMHNTDAPAAAGGAAAHQSTQAAEQATAPSESAGVHADAMSATGDVNKAKTDEEKIKEQTDPLKNPKPSALDGLSDSTKDELMTQLGGRKNMDYEGVHQADEAAKAMAKQSDVWGGI